MRKCNAKDNVEGDSKLSWTSQLQKYFERYPTVVGKNSFKSFRTDTTQDLSQKAEKIARQPSHFIYNKAGLLTPITCSKSYKKYISIGFKSVNRFYLQGHSESFNSYSIISLARRYGNQIPRSEMKFSINYLLLYDPKSIADHSFEQRRFRLNLALN
jgi:hypothetical protein